MKRTSTIKWNKVEDVYLQGMCLRVRTKDGVREFHLKTIHELDEFLAGLRIFDPGDSWWTSLPRRTRGYESALD